MNFPDATIHDSTALTHDYEFGTQFVNLDDARLQDLPAHQRQYLAGATK